MQVISILQNKLVEISHIERLQFSHILQIFVIAKDYNKSRQLWTCAVVKCVSQSHKP